MCSPCGYGQYDTPCEDLLRSKQPAETNYPETASDADGRL